MRVTHLEEPDVTRAFDGHEAELLRLFDRPESEVGDQLEALLATSPGFLAEYHLSRQRHQLLSWYPFDPASVVLEVGAGCGAMTGLLCDRVAHVHANEKFATRGEVIARRFADRPNLEVLIGGVERIRLERQADLVTCVGVWEYAGMFMPAEGDDRFTEPFARFLCTLRGLVRDGGRLLLAIENKLGLAYLAGAEEDHLHYGPLEGVEDYPGYAGVRTFSLAGARRQFAAAGFGEATVYLPFPDYKLPRLVLREDAVERLHMTAGQLGALIPWHRPRLPLINEHLLAHGLVDAEVLPVFANSFLFDVAA